MSLGSQSSPPLRGGLLEETAAERRATLSKEVRMPRPLLLFTGPWSDLPLEELAARVGDWGYQGVELACWGDHFEVQRALSDDDYCPKKLELLARHELTVAVVANHRAGQALADRIDVRHRPLLPDYVWGDGSPAGVRQRAAQEMADTVRAAQRVGAAVVSGYTGCPFGVPSPFPPLPEELLAAALDEVARILAPVLDACAECGLRFAAGVAPGQMAFDLYSAERLL